MTRNSKASGKVDLERFAAIVDAYGADERAWPEQEREGALALLQVSAEAVQLREEAASLDAMLGALPDIEPSSRLRASILEQAPQPAVSWAERGRQLWEALWPFGPSWQPAAALTAAAVIGLTFGLVLPETESSEDATVIAEVAFDTGDDWSETP